MTQFSRWMIRGAATIALALSMLGMAGCAASPEDQEKPWSSPPGYVPFSA